MAFVVADRTQETCTSPGTGVVTLLGAVNQFQSFSTGVGANNTTYYVITDQNGSNWEAGLGTIGATGLTLTRTTILSSSNAGAIVNFSTGTQNIWCDYPAGKAVYGEGTTLVAPAGALLPVANGGTNLATPGASGNALISNGTTFVSGKQTITSGTAVASTSGTSIDFTGIPSWVKRITVMFNNISTSGTSDILVQLGAGSVTVTGYLGSSTSSGTGSATSSYTTGYGIKNNSGAPLIAQGSMSISTLGSNIWVEQGCLGNSNTANTSFTGGSVTLGGTLDRVRITTVNGTDTFDAGSINILYE